MWSREVLCHGNDGEGGVITATVRSAEAWTVASVVGGVILLVVVLVVAIAALRVALRR
jgi:hypothetical protein